MLGENIKRYRLFKGLSLRAFGELTGLSQTAIMKYEKNELKPDGEKLIKFSEVLGCKVEDLLKDNSNKRTYNLNFRKRKSLTGHKLDLLKQIIYDILTPALFEAPMHPECKTVKIIKDKKENKFNTMFA